MRGSIKNFNAVEDFLSALEHSSTDEFQEHCETNGLMLAKVERPLGCGQLSVSLHTGESDVRVPIAGNVSFKGKTAKKLDRVNCMLVGDVILLRGGQAAAKFSPAAAGVIRRAFQEKGIAFPPSLFNVISSEEEDDDFFDRSDEVAKEVAVGAALKADIAKASALRAFHSKKYGSVSVEEPLAALELKEVVVAEEEEVVFTAATKKPAVKNTGLNRSERRAAAASATSESVLAGYLASRYRNTDEDVVIDVKPIVLPTFAGNWDAEDEVAIDIDAI
jgi:hypothetical protein